MSALGAVEAPVLAGVVVPSAVGGGERNARPGLQLVAAPPARGPVAGARPASQPRASSIGVRGAASRSASAPIRLTRRGRMVLAVVAVGGATIAALLISLLASGGAQASNHGQPGGPYQGMHQVVVRPGQTLWSLAAAAEPTADPRVVVQQIMSVNALTGTNILAGQLLWVPR